MIDHPASRESYADRRRSAPTSRRRRGLDTCSRWTASRRWYARPTTPEIEHHGRSLVTGEPYRSRALGVIRVRNGQIVHYADYMDAISTARLLGRTADLAAALSGA